MNYSRIYRIMHWAIAICMLLLLATIFLRLTWLNKNNVSDIIQNYLNSINVSITEDQSILLAKKIRKPMWDWHIYLGYALVGLYSIRLMLPMRGIMRFANPMSKEHNSKDKLKHWVHIIFYVFVFVSLVTGLLIEHGPKEMKKPLEEIHELSLYYLLAYIVIHFAGILMAEFGAQKGIISNIISGSKNEK